MTFDPLPPVRNGALPPFHEMPWDDFERLIVDVLQLEPGISTSQLHGTPGSVSDRGGDAIAFIEGEAATVVGSCKCYARATAGQIRKWSDEFLMHWDAYWRAVGVRRFILATSATNIAEIGIVQQIIAERARFGALGVTYELWGPAQITSKLRPHRHIVHHYLREAWADAMCDRIEQTPPSITAPSNLLGSLVIAQLKELQDQLSGSVVREIDVAVDHLRAGRLGELHVLIDRQRAEPHWSQLDGIARGAVLRLAASLALEEGDTEEAERLGAVADCEAPADEPRLAARIALARGSAEVALDVLGSPVTRAGWQLRCALLLSLDRDAEAKAILARLREEDPDDAEALRLSALACIGDNDRGEALALIKCAEQRAGHWHAVQRAGIAIRYAQALSPSLGRDFTLAPNPVVRSLVREDDAARISLVDALARVEAMIAATGATEDRIWRLAILANLPDRRAEAAASARELVADDPGCVAAIAWCVQRNLDVDLAASVAALRDAYARGAEFEEAQVLALAMASGHDDGVGVTWLKTYLPQQSEAVRSEMASWIRRLAGQGAASDPDDIDFAGEASGLAERLDAALSSVPPDPFGLVFGEQLAAHDRWEVLGSRAAAFLPYQTAGALRLAVYSAMHHRDSRLVLAFLNDHGWLFGSELPNDMQRVRADALARTGAMPEALREAALLASRSNRLHDQLFQAELHARIGDVQPFLPIVRRALAEGKLPPSQALSWSRHIERTAPELSRELVRSAVQRPLSGAQIEFAAERVMRLRLEDEFAKLLPLIKKQAESGSGKYRIVDEQMVRGLIAELEQGEALRRRLYLSGAIPVHVYVQGDAEALLRQIEINRIDPHGQDRMIPRPIRHGARPAVLTTDRSWAEWRIHLDVTGLFEAHRAGILALVERHPNGITISASLPMVLREMQGIADDADIGPAKALVAALAKGSFKPLDGPVAEANMFGHSGDDAEAIAAAAARLAIRLRREDVIGDAECRVLGGEPDGMLASPDDALPLQVTPPVLLLFAAHGLIERLADNIDLRVDRWERQRFERALAQKEVLNALGTMVGEIATRVAEGIRSGFYRLLPVADVSDGEQTALQMQLEELLSLPAVDGGVVWFDDRHLSGYVHAGPLPIVGIWEVLDAMEAGSQLTAAQSATARDRLVASGAVLLPFDPKEVAAALGAAPVRRAMVLETARLALIRRHFAATLSFAPCLKIGPAGPGLEDRPDEDVAARGLLRILSEALMLIWHPGPVAIADRFARSDWLLFNLGVMRLDRVPLGADPVAARNLMLVMQIAHCFDKAYDIGGPNDEHRILREQFLVWCWERMVKPRLGSDPGFAVRIGEFLVQTYGPLLRDRVGRSDREQRATELLIYLRVQRLPPLISEPVRHSGIFSRYVALEQRIRIADRDFDPGRFWRAARRAWRYGAARVRTVSGRRVVLRREGSALVITGAAKGRLSDELLPLIAARGGDRTEAVAAFAVRYGLGPDGRAALPSIADHLSVAAVVDRLNRARAESIEGRYQRTAQSLRDRRGAQLDELAPGPIAALAAYHGFDLSADGDVALAVQALSRKIGPRLAIARLAQLPVIAPFQWIAADLSFDDLEALRTEACTPWARVLTLVLAANRLTAEARAEGIAALVDMIVDWGEAMTCALSWTRARLTIDPLWPTISNGLRTALVWAHGGWLLHQFIAGGFEPATLIEGLGQRQEGGSLDRITTPASGVLDLADPAGVDWQALLIHGLAAIAGDQPLAKLVPSELFDRMYHLTTVEMGDERLPNIGILLRRDDVPDALASALHGFPVGLFDEPPPEKRDAILDRVLGNLGENPASVDDWLVFAVVSMRGIGDVFAGRLEAVLRATDLFGLVDASSTEGRFELWRGALIPLAAARQGNIGDSLHRLALRCREYYRGSLDEGTAGGRAFIELIELCAAVAGWDPQRFDEEMLAQMLLSVAADWPECRPAMRQFCHNLLSDADPNRYAPIWSMRSELLAMS